MMNLFSCCFPRKLHERRSETESEFKLCRRSRNNYERGGESIETTFAKLQVLKDEEYEYFNFKGKTFYAKYCNVYDGDSFSVLFFYKNDVIKYKCRMMGYDSPEMKPLLSNENRIHEKELAILAKNRLIELLSMHPTHLIKIECFEFDKYGRLLVNAWNMVNEKSINEIMVEEKHGKPYFGGKKESWG